MPQFGGGDDSTLAFGARQPKPGDHFTFQLFNFTLPAWCAPAAKSGTGSGLIGWI